MARPWSFRDRDFIAPGPRPGAELNLESATMPQSLGRWNFSDQPGVPCSPADDVARRVFADAAPPAKDQHVHVWLDGAGPVPRRRSAQDQAGRGPQVLARLAQDQSGKWLATDPNGGALTIRRAQDGTLEIGPAHGHSPTAPGRGCHLIRSTPSFGSISSPAGLPSGSVPLPWCTIPSAPSCARRIRTGTRRAPKSRV